MQCRIAPPGYSLKVVYKQYSCVGNAISAGPTAAPSLGTPSAAPFNAPPTPQPSTTPPQSFAPLPPPTSAAQDPGVVPLAKISGSQTITSNNPKDLESRSALAETLCKGYYQSTGSVGAFSDFYPSNCDFTKTSTRRSLQQQSAVLKFLLSIPNANPATLAAIISSPATLAAIQTQINANPAFAGVVAQAVQATNLSPTSAPVASPSSSSSPACFAGSEMVTMESGVSKPIRDVQVGDRIMSFDLVTKATFFTDVVYLPHGANSFRTTFTQIRTRSGRDVKVTMNHVLPAGSCDTTVALINVEAAAVSVGLCVLTTEGRDEVVEVAEVEATGIYTAITMAELVVVNGVVATPYGGVNTVVANVFYNLHRLAYSMSPRAILKSLVSQSNLESLWSTIQVLGSA